MNLADLIKVLETLGITILGVLISILILFISRSPLCDDIREKKGKKAYKDSMTKIWPLKKFFLLGYLPFIKKWHFLFFIFDVLLSFISVVIVAIIISYGSSQTLRNILELSVIATAFFKIVPLSVPWGKYRN